MTTRRYQQASDPVDLNTFQGGNAFEKIMMQFLTSPNQYYAGVYESVLDAKAGREGGKERAIRAIIVGHIILPTLFQFATDSWRHIFDEEDHEWSANEYFKSMLLGPLNGLFAVGKVASPIIASLVGANVWSVDTTLVNIGNDFVKAGREMNDGDFADALDDLLTGIAKSAPSPVTFYSIIKKRFEHPIEWLID